MYGIDNSNNEDDILQLLGFQPSAMQNNFQAQGMPQITQGLLGDTGVNQPQQKDIRDLISGGKNAAASVAQQHAQPSGGGDIPAQQADTRLLEKEQQNRQRQQQMLMKLAMMFLGG